MRVRGGIVDSGNVGDAPSSSGRGQGEGVKIRRDFF